MVNMREIREDWVEYRAGDEDSEEYKDYAAATALFDQALEWERAKARVEGAKGAAMWADKHNR